MCRPAAATTQMVFTLTTNSSITWNWQLTDYLLTVATNGVGAVDVPTAWYTPGSMPVLTATPGRTTGSTVGPAR